MKKWISIALILLVALYAAAFFVPINPVDQRPGMRLSGDPAPMSDWQSVVEAPRAFGSNLVQFETRPWYGLRHSITTTSLTRAGQFYVPCGWCSTKRWPTYIQSDPRVRIKVDGKVFERIAVRVTDEALLAALGEGPEDLWLYRLDLPK